MMALQVLKNFDIRQAARDQEVEALRQAKAPHGRKKWSGRADRETKCVSGSDTVV